MQNVMNTLFNTILVSVPEELFLTLMTLICIKRPDLLDIRMWRTNIKWLMIPVVPAALIINILKYISRMPQIFILCITVTFLYVSILYIVTKTQIESDKKVYWKTLIYLVVITLFWGALEEGTCNVLLMLIGKTLEFVNNNIFWNFVIGIPARVIAYLILAYIIIKKNSEIKIKVFDLIVSNKLYSRIMLFFAVSFNLVSLYTIKLIWQDKILENKGLIEKLIVSEALFIFPAMAIFFMIVLVNDLLVKEKRMQQTYGNLIYKDDVMADVEINYEGRFEK